MDNPEAFDLFEDELEVLIQRGHKSGLNYWCILGILQRFCCTLFMQADAEFYYNLRSQE